MVIKIILTPSGDRGWLDGDTELSGALERFAILM